MVLLGVTVVVGGAAAAFGGLAMSAAMAATIAIVSTGAKLAFDSLVQRDAPDANRGRSFARFEIRFQLAWVIGAVLPLLLLPIPEQVGFAGIAITAAFALFSYVAGQRAAHRRHAEGPAVDDEVEALERELDLTLPMLTAPTSPSPSTPSGPRLRRRVRGRRPRRLAGGRARLGRRT